MNFEQEQKERVEEVWQMICSYLPVEEGFQKTLLSAMNYSMTAGGKRLRPLLMLLTYEMLGGTEEIVWPFMAAMEMIHTHSLIHDDLPALDNDEYRRGHKTTHIVYGEAMAILAGDALLNYAYETAGKAFAMKPQDPRIGRAFCELSAQTGIYGMLGGQSVDVEFMNQTLDRNQLLFIYQLKTGALIEGSMAIGAILAGASEEELAQIREIARRVGMAFQIQDDILDVIGDLAVLGKAVNSDEKNQKVTYVSVYGMKKAKEDVAAFSQEAIALLDALPGEKRFLRELILQLIDRRA